MKVTNRSSQPLSALKPLVAFARAHAGRLAELARIEFEDASPNETCYGIAIQHDPKGTDLKPSIVKIWLSSPDARHYPLKQRHVQELEAVVLNSWTEEALLVIAHELRHIVQFWEGENEDAHFMEVDAEAFAIETLHDWRQETVSVASLIVSQPRNKAA